MQLVGARRCAVPPHLQDFILACQLGSLDTVQALWDPAWLAELTSLKEDDTCHPLLTAVHHLKPAVVEFLCNQVRAESLPAPLTRSHSPNRARVPPLPSLCPLVCLC